MISQSGGLGFAFFDRARGRNLAFRHIVTTGNEAALEVSDVIDYMLDEGKTDVFLLLLEDIKTPKKFRRVSDKALKAGKPLIVAKIGQTEAGRRAVFSHTAALAGSPAAYRAIFRHHGVIEGDDFDEMIDLAAGFLACGDKLPLGKRMGICTSSGGAGVWMADACVRAGLEVPELDAATRKQIDALIPSYGTSQNPIDSTAQGVHQLGYAAFARLAAQSPVIDGVMVVVTARRSAFLADDQAKLMALAKETKKPVFLWTYTLPAEKSVEIVNEAGYPLFKNADSLRRVHVRDGRLSGAARATVAAANGGRRVEAGSRRGESDARGVRLRSCANGTRGRCSPLTALPAVRRASLRIRRRKRKRRRAKSQHRSR